MNLDLLNLICYYLDIDEVYRINNPKINVIRYLKHTKCENDLVKVSAYGDLKTIKYLTSKNQYDEYDYNKALVNAIVNHHLEVLEYLISLGRQTCEFDIGHQKLLLQACTSGHLDIFKYLQHHPKLKLPIYGPVMHYAIINGHLHIVKYLYSQNIKNTVNSSLSIIKVIEKGDSEMFKYLMQNIIEPVDYDRFFAILKTNNRLEMLEILEL